MAYLEDFKTVWHELKETYPEIQTVYYRKPKRVNVGYFENFIHKVVELDSQYILKNDVKGDETIFQLLRKLFSNALNFKDSELDICFSEEMTNTTIDFISAARCFDKELSMNDIFQACRNLWIMNGIQYILDQKIKLTPSLFAYSLLYPYTDNYIDHPDIPFKEKSAFSERFKNRLGGSHVVPHNKNEESIFSLVEIIEKQWDRKIYPQVFDCLLQIHSAQTKSISLLGYDINPDKMFDIAIDKGGCSVMADGCLILGKLSKEQKRFLYYYGGYLQLLDDLQDIHADQAQGLQTYFSHFANHKRLEITTNKMYWMGKWILDRINELGGNNKNDFISMMERSIELFIIQSVIINYEFLNKDYLQLFQQFSPVTYNYIHKKNKQFESVQNHIYNKINNAIQSRVFTQKNQTDCFIIQE